MSGQAGHDQSGATAPGSRTVNWDDPDVAAADVVGNLIVAPLALIAFFSFWPALAFFEFPGEPSAVAAVTVPAIAGISLVIYLVVGPLTQQVRARRTRRAAAP